MRFVVFTVIVFVGLALPAEQQDDDAWVRAQIEDALRAAPPSVTADARIYAFKPDGERVLVREGDGPYTCVASGSNSLRVGLPPFPHPDPRCADGNAWAFFEAVWAESDPLNPSKPLPTAPGMVWMLEGMNIAAGGISYGESSSSMVRITGGGDGDPSEHIQMGPHLMILPLPVSAEEAQLPGVYDLENPQRTWVMGAGTSMAHMHVHFTPETKDALLKVSR